MTPRATVVLFMAPDEKTIDVVAAAPPDHFLVCRNGIPTLSTVEARVLTAVRIRLPAGGVHWPLLWTEPPPPNFIC